MKIDVIVTQHQPLVRYLRELGYANDSTPVIEHASISDISGKHVAGVLPVAMAAHCASYTEIPMSMTPADRAALRQGDLSYERMRQICSEPITYRIAPAWLWEDLRAELGILDTLRMPRTRRELLAMCRELAPEATVTRLGDRVELEHAGMHLQLWLKDGALHFEDWIDDIEDDDGEPVTADGEQGTITSPRALARRLGKLLEVEEAVLAAADPVEWLRARAEQGVGRA